MDMWGKRQNHHVLPDELNDELLSDLKNFYFSEKKDFSWPVIHYFSHLAEAFARKMGLFFFFQILYSWPFFN